MRRLFGASAPESKPAADKADVYIIINATCVELPNVQQYIEANCPSEWVVPLLFQQLRRAL